MNTLTSLVALVTTCAGLCGELVAQRGPKDQAINLWLLSLDNPAAQAKLPNNHVEANAKDPCRWKNLKPGKYVIRLDPAYEDWSAHCIAGIPVEIGDGVTTLKVKVPSGSVILTVTFNGIKPPKPQTSNRSIFRVERLQKNGKIDPYVKQWLWTKLQDGKLVGPLGFLKPGSYRITAFGIDKKYKMKDVATGDVKIDAATLKKGSALVVINKKA